jgi:ATP-dependent DNA helicase RecG
MREFPSNTRELAKEIAAFASTNVGTILIGVSDEGDLVGIPDATEPQIRDSLVRRIEGLCNGPIQPSITPSPSFAEESDLIVLVLRIPRGNQPVYYCQHVPYVRHMTEARPARPDEVIERVEEWLSLQPDEAKPRSLMTIGCPSPASRRAIEPGAAQVRCPVAVEVLRGGECLITRRRLAPTR